MATHINTIISALAAMPVQAFGATVTVRSGTGLHNTLEAADVPCRIISPLNTTSQRTKRVTPGAGRVMQTEWTIEDICYLRFVGDGLGLADIATVYVEYMNSYIECSRQLGNSVYSIDLLQQRTQVVQYPASSERTYHAVISICTFTDIVQ
jgi:hypothetical protein